MDDKEEGSTGTVHLYASIADNHRALYHRATFNSSVPDARNTVICNFINVAMKSPPSMAEGCEHGLCRTSG